MKHYLQSKMNKGLKVTRDMLPGGEQVLRLQEIYLSATDISFRHFRMTPAKATAHEINGMNIFLIYTRIHNMLNRYVHHFETGSSIQDSEAIFAITEAAQMVDSLDWYFMGLGVNLRKEHKKQGLWSDIDELRDLRNQLMHRNNNQGKHDYIAITQDHEEFNGSISYMVYKPIKKGNINQITYVRSETIYSVQRYLLAALQYCIQETEHLYDVFGDEINNEIKERANKPFEYKGFDEIK